MTTPAKLTPLSARKLLLRSIAMEDGEALDSGDLGFMARAMVQATLPHRDPKAMQFTRRNGDFSLTITAMAPGVGLPYGRYPRLLLAWIATEAVRTKSPDLVLGRSMSGFMEQLGLIPSGGRWGTVPQLRNQMTRLFRAAFSCAYTDADRMAGVNMAVVEAFDLWWEPKHPDQPNLFESTISLNQRFFNEIVNRPVPIDMRALEALKGSSLALDIYFWATYRASYLKRATEIPWKSLQDQFGSDYADTKQGRHGFKREFLEKLTMVRAVYPDLDFSEGEHGLLAFPSRTHVPKRPPSGG
ncbi:MAG: pirin [Magnetococcales bacterium]|nr:pirin [Magnetococcales bacterium]